MQALFWCPQVWQTEVYDFLGIWFGFFVFSNCKKESIVAHVVCSCSGAYSNYKGCLSKRSKQMRMPNLDPDLQNLGREWTSPFHMLCQIFYDGYLNQSNIPGPVIIQSWGTTVYKFCSFIFVFFKFCSLRIVKILVVGVAWQAFQKETYSTYLSLANIYESQW